MAAILLDIVDDSGIEHSRISRVPRIFRDRTNPLEIYNDRELIKRYRIPRHGIQYILEKINSSIETPTKRSHAIPPYLQLLASLRFYTTGGMQKLIGDSLGLSTSSICRSIEIVTESIALKMKDLIKFPSTSEEIRNTKMRFHAMAGFPNVIGAIDGTLVPIIAPSEDEHLYICRKGFHAINIQAIVDADMRFISVVSRWPGSTHDAFIWSNSSIARKFEGRQIDGWLLGDSGYPLRPWLLTPIGNPQARPEERYNSCHKRTRVIVEQSFGVLKSRFRCLQKSAGCLSYVPQKSCKIAFVCFLLHNLCINERIPLLLEDDCDNDGDDEDGDDGEVSRCVNSGASNDGKAVRNEIIRARFSY